MQDQSPGVRLLAHGGVAVAWCCQDKVILQKESVFLYHGSIPGCL